MDGYCWSTRTLSQGFPTEMTKFLELPSKNLDEMWNNLWRQFIRAIGKKVYITNERVLVPGLCKK